MNSAFQHLIDVVNGPLPESSLKAVLQKFTSECGFKYFAFVNLRGAESAGISNYPQEWQYLYLRNDYFRIDPVITQAKRGSYFNNWTVDSAKGASREVINFYGTAGKFGIRSGFSVAIPTGFGHQAVLTLASDHERADAVDPADTQIAVVATAMIYRLFNNSDEILSKEIGLTPREATCLRWIAEGKSNQEVADLLDISYRSVRFYLDESKVKLSASNAMQAVAIASRLRLI